MYAKIEEIVERLVGIPYKHNGRSTEGVDCWGVVYLFFSELGIELPLDDGGHISQEWYKKDPGRYRRALQSLGEDVGHYRNLQLLDIPYFRLYRNVVTHTGVMVDEGYFLHVLIDKEVSVGRISRRFWRKKYSGAVRINHGIVFE
ncbi:MAG: C40 family peptidase [Halanaerobiales bacterium]